MKKTEEITKIYCDDCNRKFRTEEVIGDDGWLIDDQNMIYICGQCLYQHREQVINQLVKDDIAAKRDQERMRKARNLTNIQQRFPDLAPEMQLSLAQKL